MSFVDNDHAFAACVTTLQLSTALAYRPIEPIDAEPEIEDFEIPETVRELLIDQ